MDQLSGKTIVLGVTGSIAAYKALELLRLFLKAGAEVKVVLTKEAAQFIPPLTWESLSGNPVIVDLFENKSLIHIEAVQGVDLLAIVPVTANILAKLQYGIADDALTTIALAYPGPLLLAPAMNDKMYRQPATQDNLAKLKARPNTYIAESETGELACGDSGEGRLRDVRKIFQLAADVLSKATLLSGLNVLITAGSTLEPLDPVRYIANRSSGRMGYALAAVAQRRGAAVTLISGPTNLTPPGGVKVIVIETAQEMLTAVKENFPACDVLIMSAAVADYRPQTISTAKIKKDQTEIILKLMRNPDILKEIQSMKTKQTIIGFALETEDLQQRAVAKLKEKNLDLIVANEAQALGSETSAVTLIDRRGEIQELPLQAKWLTAEIILDKIKQLRGGNVTMEKQQLQERAEQLKKELADLQKEYDELCKSLKSSTLFPTVETEREIELLEKTIKERQLILKEFKEFLRAPR